MKSFFIFITLLCVSFSAFSQKYLGGTIGVAVENIDSNTAAVFQIAPEGGYKFNNVWAAGASLTVQIGAGGDNDMTSIGIIPYVRATFARVGIVDFFGEFAMGYVYLSIDGYDGHGFTAGIRPGLAINFSDKFALIGRTTLLNYSYCDDIHGVGLTVNGNFAVGMQYTF